MISPDQTNSIFTLAAEFINHTSRSVFLTGKAGTGKTTFLRYIRHTTPKKCAVVAPTGVAAINAGGMTMHSLFQLPFGLFLPGHYPQDGNIQVTNRNTLFQNLRLAQSKRNLLKELELLIIDEVSMVRCDMLDATDAILRYVRRSSQPFGGVQLLYIGDLYQLPPVVQPPEWNLMKEHYESPFFFDSKVVQQFPPLCIQLEKIYRQNEQTFIDLLNHVRNNEVTDEDIALLNTRFVPEARHASDHITLTTHNYKADAINRAELDKLPGKVFKFSAIIAGEFPERNIPTEMVLSLKKGTKIMFIKNDADEERKYYNGKLATVTDLDEEKIVVTFENNETYELKHEVWRNIHYSYNTVEDQIEEEELGSFSQYPIRLAWAITIHKSQGLTFEKAIIDASDSFAAGQVYVALSRCTSLEGLMLRSRITPSQISTDEKVMAHAQYLETEESLSHIIGPEKDHYEQRKLVALFNLDKEIEAVRHWGMVIEEKKSDEIKEAEAVCRHVLIKLTELAEVARKFQKQLEDLLTLAIKSGDYEPVNARTEKAVTYFNNFLKDEVYASIMEHAGKVKGKSKIKRYAKGVNELAALIYHKGEKIRAARLKGNRFHEETESDLPPPPPTPVKTENTKKEKGSTQKESLALYRQGKSVQEIATQRGLSPVTIEGHLASFVRTGEIGIHEMVSEAKLPIIMNLLREMDNSVLAPIKDKLGNDYSFAEIKATVNYMEKVKAETANASSD